MNNLRSSVNSSNNIEWRRSKVLQLASHGLNQSEISRTLQISQPTINRDFLFLRQQAKQNIRRYIDERLPEEYEKCLVGLNSIVKEAWTTSQQTQDRREKIQALSLAKDCYAMKLELLTNATVIDDAIRFITTIANSKEPKIRTMPNCDAKPPFCFIIDGSRDVEQSADNKTTIRNNNQVF